MQKPKSPFCELDINVPIRRQLSNLLIIEYPVIHIFLPSHSPDVKVIKNVISQQVQPKADPVNASQPEPEGVFFKEEEIKDHDSSDSHVLDLKDKSSSKTETKYEGLVHDSADPHVLDITDKSNNKTETQDQGVIHKALDSTSNDNDLADLVNFDFETGLIDIYSSLMSESNPDDFLDFEGLCDDLPSKGEDIKCGFSDDELEEGEIADSD